VVGVAQLLLCARAPAANKSELAAAAAAVVKTRNERVRWRRAVAMCALSYSEM